MNSKSWAYKRFQSKIRATLKKSPGLWQEICAHSEEIELKRGDTLVKQLKTNKHVFVIVKGAFECILKTKQSNTNLVWFFFDNAFDVISGMDNCLNINETEYKILAIEPSIVIKIELEKIDNWRKNYPAFDEYRKNEAIKWFSNYFEIRNNLLALQPLEFLDYLKANYPDMLERISSLKLAHFMGITPEWLSKLKKRKQLNSIK